VADCVDNYFGRRRFIEDQIGIRRCRHAANNAVVGANADVGMIREKVDDGSYARLNTLGALRGVRVDKI
jgi:hypothetical protein